MICKLVIFLFTLIVSTHKAQAYDYFKLAIQWPPTFCKVSTCVQPVPRKFNIHGLWPQTYQSPQPQFCNPSVLYNKTQISPIIPRLQLSMKTLLGKGQRFEDKFWGHKWKTHGTCSLQTFNQLAYFTQTLNLFAQTEPAMLNELRKIGISPGGPPRLRTSFSSAMRNIHNGNVEEVRFCLDRNGQTFINCTSPGKCNSLVTMPN